MKTLHLLSIVLSLVAVPAIAVAHPDDGAPNDNRRDHRAELRARFDANHDGRLDDAERAALREHRVNERFDRLDVNRDGVVTRAEFAAAAKARWQGKAGRHARWGRHPRRSHSMGSDGSGAGASSQTETK